MQEQVPAGQQISAMCMQPLSLDARKLSVRTPTSDPTSPNTASVVRPDLDRRHSDSANYSRLDQGGAAGGGGGGKAQHAYQNTTIAAAAAATSAMGSGSTIGSDQSDNQR